MLSFNKSINPEPINHANNNDMYKKNESINLLNDNNDNI